ERTKEWASESYDLEAGSGEERNLIEDPKHAAQLKACHHKPEPDGLQLIPAHATHPRNRYRALRLLAGGHNRPLSGGPRKEVVQGEPAHPYAEQRRRLHSRRRSGLVPRASLQLSGAVGP